MLSGETVATFFVASVVLGLAPGPDNIFVLTQSAVRGRGAGLLVTLGLCTGLVVHSLAVALGVAALFQTSMVAFTGLKVAGACYLAYLAWKAFRSPAESLRSASADRGDSWRLYRRGIIMNVTNPKVSVFFLAFLPQFADPTRGSVTLQILLLGGLFICATVLTFGSVALLAGALGRWLSRSDRAQVVMNRIAGTVFLALALKLATADR